MPRCSYPILAGLLALALPSIGQEPPTADEYTRLRAELLVQDEKELREIQEAIEAAPRIAPLAAKINAAWKGPKRNQKRFEQLRDQLPKDFPGVEILTYGLPMETDPVKLRVRLTEFLSKKREQSVGQCFDAEKRTFSDSTPCRERLNLSCLELESDGKGNLSATVVEEDLSIMKKVQFDSLERLKQDYEYAFVEGTPALCKLASLSGKSFQAHYPAAYPFFAKGAAGYPMVFPDPESLRDQCFAVDIEATREAIARIEGRFPDTAKGFSFSGWKKNLDNREKRCAFSVQTLCRNTYVLSGQVILAYRTKGCEVREVTAEDVDADVKKMVDLGITRADQLNHLQLKETIMACQTAQDRGFTWNSVGPPMGDCGKAKATPKKP